MFSGITTVRYTMYHVYISVRNVNFHFVSIALLFFCFFCFVVLSCLFCGDVFYYSFVLCVFVFRVLRNRPPVKVDADVSVDVAARVVDVDVDSAVAVIVDVVCMSLLGAYKQPHSY